MSGIQEILVLIIIIMLVFYLPKLRGVKEEEFVERRAFVDLSWRMRLSIVGSIFWLGLATFFLEPWHKEIFPFLYYGVGPVVLLWGIGWVIVGYRKYRR